MCGVMQSPTASGSACSEHHYPGALQGRAEVLADWQAVLQCALQSPCLAALLASGGYLDQILRDFGQVGAQYMSAWARRCLDVCDVMLWRCNLLQPSSGPHLLCKLICCVQTDGRLVHACAS